MEKLLDFISKQLRFHRRLLLAYLALLSLMVLVDYNLQYQSITTTYPRHNGTTHDQHTMRRITNTDPPITASSSELKNKTNIVEYRDKATKEMKKTHSYDRNKDRKTISGVNERRPYNPSFADKTLNDTINKTQSLSNFDLKKIEKETTSKISITGDIRTEIKKTSKLKSLHKNNSELNPERKTTSKGSTINKTKNMYNYTTRALTVLKLNKTINQALSADKAKKWTKTTTERMIVSLITDQFPSEKQISNNRRNETLNQNKTGSFSFRNPLVDIVSENFFEPYCAMFSNSFKYLIWPDSPSDFSDWTFKRKRKCPNFKIPDNINDTKRVKYTLNCNRNNSNLIPSLTYRSDDIQIVALDDPCLAAFTNSCCNGTRGIPNLVHYVWYFKNEMNFMVFTSILSVIRFVRPCLILFHGEYLPYGKYWDYIVRIYPNILHVYTVRPLYIYGKKISHHEHSGDIMRMEALMQLGGIYLDTDIIVFRDLEPLREYDITLCYQTTGYLTNGFIMAKRNATFLNLWMDGYRKDYKNDSYVYNSMFYNKDLANNRSDLIHIEQGTICSPLVLIGRPVNSTIVYDWTKLFGYHLYARTIHFPLNENWIQHFNSTVGAMIRHVIYGNKELCEGPTNKVSLLYLLDNN